MKFDMDNNQERTTGFKLWDFFDDGIFCHIAWRETEMILEHMRMTVAHAKRNELLQTVFAIVGINRRKKGCIGSGLYQDLEDDRVLHLIEEWETQKDLENYLQSDRFSALLGAVGLLVEPPQIKLQAISYTAGMEAVETTRSGSHL